MGGWNEGRSQFQNKQKGLTVCPRVLLKVLFTLAPYDDWRSLSNTHIHTFVRAFESFSENVLLLDVIYSEMQVTTDAPTVIFCARVCMFVRALCQ